LNDNTFRHFLTGDTVPLSAAEKKFRLSGYFVAEVDEEIVGTVAYEIQVTTIIYNHGI
jgi:hypothetical protein